MMNVRRVRMTVREGRVRVPVCVRLAGRIAGRMRVLVMLVVHVPVRVRQRLVHVKVLVSLCEVQP